MDEPMLWNEHIARTYDDASAEMYAPEVLDPTVDFLAQRAGAGRALEFAIGTGRVAIPLAERGINVTGIDSSRAMVAELWRKVDRDTMPVVIGDMTSVAVPGEFDLVYLVYNTITNLLTQADQVACFRNAAQHLVPGGAFVVEVFVPPLQRLSPGQRLLAFDVSDDHIGVDTFDLVQQRMVSHHVWPDEGTVFRTPHRYVWPSELDLMAQLAGMTLDERVEDFGGTPFTDSSTAHVSVWRTGA